jgi:6-phosphogluconolactonase (cycloisomerase 2 family)
VSLTGGPPATAFGESGLASGTVYSLSVQTQPTSPAQHCAITGGGGTISASVTGVSVVCRKVGQYLYVTNPFDSNGTPPDGTVAAYNIDPTTGALGTTPLLAPVHTADANPRAIAVDATDSYIYIANQGSGNVSSEALTSGVPSVTDASALPVLASTSQPLSIALDPSGFLYVGALDSSGSPTTHYIAGFSVTAGVLAALTPASYSTGDLPLALALDSTGSYLYSTDEYLADIASWSITANTGALVSPTPPTSTAIAGNYAGVAVNGNYVYATDQANAALYLIPAASGVLAPASTTYTTYTVGTDPQAIAIDPTGTYLYVSNAGDGTVSGFTISPTDGTLTPMSTPFFASLPAAPGSLTSTPTAISIDPSGQFLYVANGDAGSVTPFLIGAGGLLSPIGGSGSTPAPVSTTANSGGPSSIAIF